MSEQRKSTRFINCETCQTEGRILRSNGGPDDIDCGVCPACNGACVVEVEVEPVTLEEMNEQRDILERLNDLGDNISRAEAADEIASLQAQLAKAESWKLEYDANQADLSRIATLQAQLAEEKAAVSALNGDIHEMGQQLASARKALEEIKRESAAANEVIRLKRGKTGQGFIRVATALHRIAALTDEITKGLIRDP